MSDFEEEQNFENEESECSQCAMNNYPEFALEPDGEALQDGIKDGSYLTGFVGSLGVLGLSENSLMQIILSKLDFGHSRELLRMQMASEERKAELWSKSKTTFIQSNDLD